MKKIIKYLNEALINKNTKFDSTIFLIDEILKYCEPYFNFKIFKKLFGKMVFGLSEQDIATKSKIDHAIKKWILDNKVEDISFTEVFYESMRPSPLKDVKKILKICGADIDKLTFNYFESEPMKYCDNLRTYYNGCDDDDMEAELSLFITGNKDCLKVEYNFLTKTDAGFIDTMAHLIFQNKL